MVRIIDDTPFQGSTKPQQVPADDGWRGGVGAPTPPSGPQTSVTTVPFTPAPLPKPSANPWDLPPDYGSGQLDLPEPQTQSFVPPYSPPPNPFGVTATGKTSTLIPQQVDIWPSAEELDLSFSGLGIFDDKPSGFASTGSVWDVIDTERRIDFIEDAIRAEVLELVRPEYRTLFDIDPSLGIGHTIRDEMLKNANDLINDREWIKKLLGIDDEQLDQIPRDALNSALIAALNDYGNSLSAKELGDRFLATLRAQWSKIYDIIDRNKGFSLIDEAKLQTMPEGVRKRVEEIKKEMEAMDQVENSSGGLPYQNVELFSKFKLMSPEERGTYKNSLISEMQKYFNETDVDPAMLRGTAAALFNEEQVREKANEFISLLVENPAVYNKIKEINDAAKEIYLRDKYQEVIDKYPDVKEFIEQNPDATLEDVWKKFSFLPEFRFKPHVKPTIFEEDLFKLLDNEEYVSAIRQNPADFLAVHFKFLSPEQINKFIDSDIVYDRMKLYSPTGVKPFIEENIKDNPFNIERPFTTPLEKVGHGISKGLQFVGVPEEIAEPAGMVAAYTPVMVSAALASSTGIGAFYTAGLTYLAVMETIPRIANDPLSRESVIALADFGVSAALFSPATNAAEDAITAAIVRSLPKVIGNQKAIQTAIAMTARTGINIAEDVPTTAAVLAIAGVQPGSEEWNRIMKETVIFDTAIGVALPLSSRYFVSGLPEIGTFAVTYMGARYGMGASEEDARNAAISMAISVAIARHSGLARAIEVGSYAADAVKALASRAGLSRYATDIFERVHDAALAASRVPGEITGGVKQKIGSILAPKVIVYADDADYESGVAQRLSGTVVQDSSGKVVWDVDRDPLQEIHENIITELYRGPEGKKVDKVDVTSMRAAIESFYQKLADGFFIKFDPHALAESDPLYVALSTFEGSAMELEDALTIVAAANGSVRVRVEDASVRSIDPFRLEQKQIKVFGGNENGIPEKFGEAFVDINVGKNGRIIAVITEFSGDDPIKREFAIKRVIGELIDDKRIDAISFTETAYKDNIGIIKNIAKETGIKYDVLRNPDSLVIELKDASGRALTNLDAIQRAAGKTWYTDVAKFYETYTRYKSPVDLVKDLGRDTLASIGSSLGVYLWNEYIEGEDQEWSDIKKYFAIAMLGLAGTTGARLVGGQYHIIANPHMREVLQSTTVDVYGSRLIQRQKLTFGEHFGNLVSRIFMNSAKRNVPILTPIAKEIRKLNRASRDVGVYYKNKAQAIVNGRLFFEKNEIFVRNSDGEKIPVLTYDNETGDIKIEVDDEGNVVYASAADIAARMPLYEKFYGPDSKFKDVFSAIKDLGELVRPISEDLAQHGLFEKSRWDINTYGGFYLPRGEMFKVDDDGKLVEDYGSSTVTGVTSTKTSAEKHAMLFAQGAIAAKSEGAYADPVTAIGAFATHSSRRIGMVIFSELIRDLNMQYHFAKTADEFIGEDLVKYRDELAKSIFSATHKLHRAVARLNAEMRAELRADKSLETLLKRQQEVEAKLADERLDRDQKVAILREQLKETRAALNKNIRDLRQLAEKEGASQERLNQLNKLEVEINREFRAIARDIVKFTNPENRADLMTGLLRPKADPEAYNEALVAVHQILTDFAERHTEMKQTVQTIKESVANKLKMAQELARQERESQESIAGLQDLIERQKKNKKSYRPIMEKQSEEIKNLSDLAQKRVELANSIRDDIINLQRTLSRKLAKNIVNKSSDTKSSRDSTRKAYIAAKNMEQHVDKIVSRLERMEIGRPGAVQKVGSGPVLKEIGRIENEVINSTFTRMTAFVDKYIETANQLSRNEASIAAAADSREAAKQSVKNMLSDIFKDKQELGEIERKLGKTLESSAIAKLEVRMKELNKQITRLQERIQRSQNVSEAKRQLIDKLKKDLEDLTQKKAEVDSIYKSKLAQVLGQRRINVVDLPELRTVVFNDPAYARAINKEFERGAGSLENVVAFLGSLNNLGRSMMATGDASFVGVTGLLAAYNYPASVLFGLKQAIASVADPAGFALYIQKYDEASKTMNTPSAIDWVRAGLHIADYEIPGGELAEFTSEGKSVIGSLSEKLNEMPVVKQSNLLYTITGNVVRLEIARNLAALRLHEGMSSDMRISVMRGIAEEVNKITGFTEKAFGDIGPGMDIIAQLTQFAPRWFASQLGTIADAATKRDVRGAMAREFLMRMIGIGSLLTIVANDMLGNETDFDITSGNFMRIRIGDYDVSLFGPWDSLVRGMIISAQAIPGVPGEGNLLYMPRSKASPIVSTIWDVAQGETVVGEPINAHYFMRRVLPFSMNNIINAYENYQRNDDISMAEAITNGVIAMMSSVFGIKASPLSKGERYRELLREANIDHEDPLAVIVWTGENKDKLAAEDLVRVTDYTIAKSEHNEKIDKITQRFIDGEINNGEWVKLIQRENAEYYGKIQVILGDDKMKEKPDHKLSKKQLWIKKGFAIYDEALNDETGEFDIRLFNRLVNEYIDTYGEEAWDYFNKYTMADDNPVLRERNEAIKKLSRLKYNGEIINYFEIPKIKPGVLNGMNSWPKAYGEYDQLDYEDLLQKIVDYVENERAIGGKREIGGQQYFVNNKQDFMSSLTILIPEIQEEVLPYPGMWSQAMYYDILSFRKTSNKNPLIDKIRELYPYETAFFDKDITYGQIIKRKNLTK